MVNIDEIHLQTVPSTNTYAKENISSFRLPALITANGQTAGRGRRGNSFYSPDGTGLYMTLVFPAPQKSDLLTPAAAVAVCKALESLEVQPEIKWVNDIFISGHKVCGILTECFSYCSKTYIALGVGINLTTSVFPEDLQIAGSINLNCDKTDLARDISEKILEYIENPNDNHILTEYRKRLFVLGKKISYQKNNTEYSATVKDINNQCNLIVERADGFTDTLSSGEISIKI